jgi:myo-inositol 2-dehydrogenase/D-chiro-inositol 1-dehydrogenase
MGLTVAMAGVGRMGQQHARNLSQLPQVDRLLIADAVPEVARSVAEQLEATTCDSAEEAIAAADALVIAAATDAHAGLVRRGIERGIPVFCEKPLALDLGETVELTEQVEASGVQLMMGFQRRHDRAYREARRLIESGELGRLYLVKLHAHDMDPPPADYIPVSGGLFRDSSIHDFDLLRWLSGQEAVELFAMGSVRVSEVFAEHDDVDTAAAIIRLADGALVVLGQTRHDPLGYDIRTELIGSRDSVVVGLDARTPQRSLEDGVSPPRDPYDGFLARFADAYREEMRVFLEVADGRCQSPCTARDGLEAMRIAVAATRSRSEGRPIRLDEIT